VPCALSRARMEFYSPGILMKDLRKFISPFLHY
jgi:hypothetical protein